jgi:hypothetical protein
MHRVHSGFTVAVPIKDGQWCNLRELLKKVNNEGDTSLINFTKSDTTLFVSGVVLPSQPYSEETLPNTFVFATTYWGPLSNHLSELVATNKKGLCKIFEHCVDFCMENEVEDQELIDYLKSHSYKSAFNSSYNCITKNDVQQEKDLVKQIEEYIDKAQSLNAFDQLSAVQIKTLIERFVKTQDDKYEWSYKPDRKSVLEFGIINRGPIISVVFITLLLKILLRRPKLFVYVFGAAFAFVVLIWATLRHISSKQNKPASRPDDKKVREVGATQLHPVINEMTAAAPLKIGRVRRFFYSAALRVINLFAPFLMKIPTVSSIRWLTIDKKKRLLFLSNYSNTTDFYVRDFLTGSTPRGVNFMFTNGKGFPDAKMLLRGGIKEAPEGYMDAVHTGQQVTDLWYAHDPLLTADIIKKNRKIRHGLFKKMNEEEAKEWLKLL